MPAETRDLKDHYFNINAGAVVRVRRVRGDLDSYDGLFETLETTWWLEGNGHRQPITHSEVWELLTEEDYIEPIGLANYFADSVDLGSVVSHQFTSRIDFIKSFGREKLSMFPHLADGVLRFSTSKSFGAPIVTSSEFYDITINLKKQEINQTLFWSGNRNELFFMESD